MPGMSSMPPGAMGQMQFPPQAGVHAATPQHRMLAAQSSSKGGKKKVRPPSLRTAVVQSWR
jgi:hypothetical protein